MVQKQKTLRVNISPNLIIINLIVIHLMQKIKNKELVIKSDISGLINDSDLNKKLETLATKAELKAKQYKIVKLKMHDLSYFPFKIILAMMDFKIVCLSANIYYITGKKG